MSDRPSSQLTKAHLDGVIAIVREDFREFVAHFNNTQHGQNEWLDQMDSKLDAIIEMLAMRKEMQNLVRELKVVGVPIDESKVFIS